MLAECLPASLGGKLTTNSLTTKDGTVLYYKDWVTGPVVVFSHGYPLSADAWDYQWLLLAQHGHRVIARDRRGFGRSSQPGHGTTTTLFADDLAALIKALDLKKVTPVGHLMGSGEVARYIGRSNVSLSVGSSQFAFHANDRVLGELYHNQRHGTVKAGAGG